MNLNSSGYALRNADFIVPRYNTVNFGKHSIRYLGPVLWSKLSMDVKDRTHYKFLKIELDE